MTSQQKKIIIFIAWNVFWLFFIYILWNKTLWFEIFLEDFKPYKSFMREFCFPFTIGTWSFGQIIYSVALLKSKKIIKTTYLGIFLQIVIGIIPMVIWTEVTILRGFGDVGNLFQKEHVFTALDVTQNIGRSPELFVSKFIFLWFRWSVCVVAIFYALKRAAIRTRKI